MAGFRRSNSFVVSSARTAPARSSRHRCASWHAPSAARVDRSLTTSTCLPLTAGYVAWPIIPAPWWRFYEAIMCMIARLPHQKAIMRMIGRRQPIMRPQCRIRCMPLRSRARKAIMRMIPPTPPYMESMIHACSSRRVRANRGGDLRLGSRQHRSTLGSGRGFWRAHRAIHAQTSSRICGGATAARISTTRSP